MSGAEMIRCFRFPPQFRPWLGARGLLAGVALGAVAACLSACSVGPDFHQPDSSAPADWHAGAPAAASRPVAARIDARWWTIYRDPVLIDLEQRVGDANLDLRIAAERFAQSMAERRIAAAAELPQVDGAASYARERASPNGVLNLLGTTEQPDAASVASGAPGFGPTTLPGSTGSSAFNLMQYGVSTSWELDFWGHVRREVEAATAAVAANQDMRRDVLVSLMAETAQDYVDLRGVQAQIDITRQTIDIARRSVDLTMLRFGQGTATRLNVAEAQGQLHGFEARLPVLRGQETHLINALSFLIAREPGALKGELGTAELGATAAIPAVPAAIPVGLPSELAERRPDIRAAADRLHAATATVGVAMADFYPRITLSGSLDVQSLQFGDLGNWSSRQYGFGPTFTLPIFEGGRLKGQLELRKAQEKEAALHYQRTVLHAWREIDDAMADFSAAQNQRDRLSDAVEQNRVAVDIARTRYEQGAGDFLTVLTVQNALLTSRNEQVQATANVSRSIARLYRALGGGWEERYPLAHDDSAPLADNRPDGPLQDVRATAVADKDTP